MMPQEARVSSQNRVDEAFDEKLTAHMALVRSYEDPDFGGENPYWDIVRTLPHDDLFSWRNEDRFMPASYPHFAAGMTTEEFHAAYEKYPNRWDLIPDYAFAIPAPRSLRWLTEILDGRPVVEIGAGMGYWAWMLSQYGVDIVAYDAFPPDTTWNSYFDQAKDEKGKRKRITREEKDQDRTIRKPTHYEVRKGRQNVLHRHSDRVLFLCWPPYGAGMAVDVLSTYEGETLVLIGEGEGGCTGDDDFFQMLRTHWELLDTCPYMVQWSGIHDEMEVYRRRTPEEVAGVIARGEDQRGW